MRLTKSILAASALLVGAGAMLMQPMFSTAGTFSGTISSGGGQAAGGGGATLTSWSGPVDFFPIGTTDCDSVTIDAPGLLTGDTVVIGDGAWEIANSDSAYTVSAIAFADTAALIRLCCLRSSGCSDPPLITFTVVRIAE